LPSYRGTDRFLIAPSVPSGNRPTDPVWFSSEPRAPEAPMELPASGGTWKPARMVSQRAGNFPERQGSFPAAPGTSQFKKVVPFPSGNFPIQKDGIFSCRELPGGARKLPGCGGNFPIQKRSSFFFRGVSNLKKRNIFPPGN